MHSFGVCVVKVWKESEGLAAEGGNFFSGSVCGQMGGCLRLCAHVEAYMCFVKLSACSLLLASVMCASLLTVHLSVYVVFWTFE